MVKSKKITYKHPLLHQIPRKDGIIVTIGNSKGGVSKTTTTMMLGYMCAKMGLKTLLVDSDKQGNLTKTLFNTRANRNPNEDYPVIQKTFMQGIKDRDLKGTITPIMDDLDIVPGYSDTQDFSRYSYTEAETQNARDFLLKESLESVRFDYDIILIDSPPNHYELMRNVTLASDYVIVAFQPHEHSLTGAETYVQDLSALNKEYNLELYILGFLPALFKKKSDNDLYILEQAVEEFDESNIFKSIVYLMERPKGWDIEGIKENDPWDIFTLRQYKKVADEFIGRLAALEGGEE